VSKIQYDQKIMEKESLRKMSEIEGGSFTSNIIQRYFCVLVCHQVHLYFGKRSMLSLGIMQ